MTPLAMYVAVALSSRSPTPGDELRICVVQPSENYHGDVIHGGDAWSLAPELAKHKLLNGRSIVGVAVTGRTRREADATAGRQRCEFVVELWRHQSADPVAMDEPPGVSSPDDQIIPSGDSDGIVFELSRFEPHKVIVRGFAPPLTHYGRSARIVTPYPVFAKNIITKLNTLQPLHVVPQPRTDGRLP